MLALFIGISYTVFRSPVVQTYLVNKILGQVSEEVRGNVRIGGVDITLWKGFVLEDVKITDKHSRLLFYSTGIGVDIDYLEWNGKGLGISYIQLFNPDINLVKYRGRKDWNYQFLVDAFKSDDTLATTWNLNIAKIVFFNTSFSMKDKHAIGISKVISPKDLSLMGINGEIRNFNYSADGISGKLIEISVREKSGLRIENLTADILVSDTAMILDSVQVHTKTSNILSYMSFYYDGYEGFEGSPGSVQIDIQDKLFILSIDANANGGIDIRYRIFFN